MKTRFEKLQDFIAHPLTFIVILSSTVILERFLR